MAVCTNVVSGCRSDGSTEKRVDLEFSEQALNYHSISFLETWKQRAIREKTMPANYLDFTEVIDTGTIHGYYIKEWNTWDTWCLIPTSDLVVAPAQVLTNYTDLPIWNGSLDETQVLNTYPTRQMTSGSWEFELDFDYGDYYLSIYELYTNLLESIHGQERIIVLTADRDNMYQGRVFIENFEDPADGGHVKVTIGYNIKPFVYDAGNSCLIRYYDSSEHALTEIQNA